MSGRTRRERRNSQARRRYKDRNDPLLPIEPFQQWLRHRVMENSITGVASNVGVSRRRISLLIQGWYPKKLKSGEMIKQPIKHVRLSTVDNYCMAFEDHVHSIYHPEMIKNYRRQQNKGDRRE